MHVRNHPAIAGTLIALFTILDILGGHRVAQLAQPAPQTYKGLEVSVASVTRTTNVSLADCPAGANTVRGVIRPGDLNEFTTVLVNFKALPSFRPVTIPKPTLTDATGKIYNTAQAFADVGSVPSFSCTFAFRLPKGAKVSKFILDTVSFDLGTFTQ